MIGAFVTGTDTGVGKTFVTAALARRARAAGKRVLAFKPIETGCTGLGEDQRELCAAAGGWQEGPLQGLYRLREPVAPWVAAVAEGVEIDVDLVVRTAKSGMQNVEIGWVEGAGGWRVPITQTCDMGGFAKRLDLPVIVVARASLGTINHTLLTLEAVERDGCRVAGVVISQRPEDDARLARSNVEQIGARWPGRIVRIASDPSVLDVFHVEP